jgi:hypothetical protein
VSTFAVGLGAVPFLLCADVVDHVAEVVVGGFVVGVKVVQVVFWEFEDDGQEYEELAGDFFEDVAVEGVDLVEVFADDFVPWLGGVRCCCFGDVELYEVSLGYCVDEGRAHHLDVLFDSGVADPARVLAVTEVLALGEIAWDGTFLLQWLLEEGVDADPEPNFCHGVIKLTGELLLASWLVKAGKVDLHQGCPVKRLFGGCWAAPWFDEDTFGGGC